MPKEVRWTLQNRQEIMPICQYQEKQVLQTQSQIQEII